jgi:DNA-binding NarL/FixJ family response regulator
VVETLPSGGLSPTSEKACRPPINLLISDDSHMGCELLKSSLKRSRPDFNVVGCAVTRSEIIDSMNAHSVDVALISESLQDGPLMGFEALDELHAAFPKTRTIVLLKSAPHDLVVDAFRGGAKGVFCRAEPLQALCKCIHSVHQGQIWANSHQLHFVLEALVNAKPLRVVNSAGHELLTKRENDVVNLVVDGLSNREVAQKLDLSEHTVSNYLFRVYEKLGISSRVELVLYAIQRRQQR